MIPSPLWGEGRVKGLSCGTELAGGGEEGVLHEHGDGHEADAARHGGDGARLLRGRFEIHVARELARVETVDADVYDDSARLDHVAGDEMRPARGHTEDVGPATMRSELPRARMAHGHGGVAREQQLGQRLAHEARASDHDGLGPLERNAGVVEDLAAAARRARHHGWLDRA